MANQVAKIPTRSFLVVKNARSDWPNNSQFVTLFYRDSSNKYLKQTKCRIKVLLNILSKVWYLQPHTCLSPRIFFSKSMKQTRYQKRSRTWHACKCSEEQGWPGKEKQLLSLFWISWNLSSTRLCILSRLSEDFHTKAIDSCNCW